MQNQDREKEELTEKFVIVQELMQQGKISFRQDSKVVESLQKVRFGSDGKVDPSSVDSLARAFANGIATSRYIEELKKISLEEVQLKYFEMLEGMFGSYYNEMVKHDLTPHHFASFIASKKPLVQEFAEKSNIIAEEILEFWKTFGLIVELHLQELNTLKSVFGGDIFPPLQRNLISRVGLYVDTVVLPDPMLQVSSSFEHFNPDRSLYYFTKHALSALSIKKVVLAGVNPPIVVIAPNHFRYEEDLRNFITLNGKHDLLTHFGKVFGLEFENESDLDQYLKNINSIGDLKAKLNKPNRLLFDVEWSDLPLEEQLQKTEEEIKILRSDFVPLSIGQKIKFIIIGRLLQVNELVFKADQVRGVPIVEAPTPWQYFLWKYEYDQERSRDTNPEFKNLLVVNSLASKQLIWLGKVPYEALIKLRQEGALNEIRQIFSMGIGAIDNANESTYEETINEITKNIERALAKHQKELEESSSKAKKFFGFDVAPWIVNGGISLAAASSGNIPLSIASAALGILGCSSAKDLWVKGKTILKENSKIKRSPVGILFNANKEAF